MLAFTVFFALALGWCSVIAYADGDPASDVLASQPLFLSQDAGFTAEQQGQLTADLSALQRSGDQIRVAIIASPADLGSVTELWRQPQNYAHFLGAELSLLYRGPLLVVMPNGLGTYRLGQSSAAAQSSTNEVRARGLEGTALAAIRRFAAVAGVTLAAASSTAAPQQAQTDAVSWIVLATGGALMAVAWTASLRARPVQLRPKNIRSP